GAQIRDGIKSVAAQGVCSEKTWPYSDKNQDPNPCPKCPYAKKPSAKAYTEAKKLLVQTYQRVPQDLDHFKGCLADGYPFVFCFTVYARFESQAMTNSGIDSTPAAGEKVVGGHAVLAVGYDDSKQQFIVRNSWGT